MLSSWRCEVKRCHHQVLENCPMDGSRDLEGFIEVVSSSELARSAI